MPMCNAYVQCLCAMPMCNAYVQCLGAMPMCNTCVHFLCAIPVALNGCISLYLQGISGFRQTNRRNTSAGVELRFAAKNPTCLSVGFPIISEQRDRGETIKCALHYGESPLFGSLLWQMWPTPSISPHIQYAPLGMGDHCTNHFPHLHISIIAFHFLVNAQQPNFQSFFTSTCGKGTTFWRNMKVLRHSLVLHYLEYICNSNFFNVLL